MNNPGQEYVNDLEEIAKILHTAVVETMQKAATRVTYASIEVDNVTPETLFIPRDSRKKLFIHLAVYGNALTKALTYINFRLGEPPLPTSIFVVLSVIAGTENIPVAVVAQVAATVDGLVAALQTNDADVLAIKPLLSTAYLQKMYSDIAEKIDSKAS